MHGSMTMWLWVRVTRLERSSILPLLLPHSLTHSHSVSDLGTLGWTQSHTCSNVDVDKATKASCRRSNRVSGVA